MILNSFVCSGMLGTLFGKLRLKTAMRTDKRMRILNEIISAIRIVKMYAWECLFAKMVVDARRYATSIILCEIVGLCLVFQIQFILRRDEVSWIKRTAALRALNATLHHISSKIVVFVTLLVYVLMGNSINSEKVRVLRKYKGNEKN
jgi:ATP-binding cassette subfamily C (CFTR/MRP) protein 4